MIIGLDASRAALARRTGAELYAVCLLQALIPLAESRGHRLRLYFNRPPPSSLFPQSAAVRHVVIPFPRLWTHLRLGWELRRRPPDVFFTPAHVIPWGYPGRAVATVHDLGYHYFPQAHTRRQWAYLRWSTAHNARRARLLLADSQATKDDLARLYLVPPDRIILVYPGPPPGVEPVADLARLAAVRQKYALRPPYLLYLGTLQPRKNLARLVHAFADFAITDETHQLVLAGNPGWLSAPILDQIQNLKSKIKNRILLPGYVPDDDKVALLSGAAALVYPSLYEGFGFPILEAQVCGVPVLASNTSSLPEVAGPAALLVDPLDTAALTAALHRITADEPLRRSLVEQGHANLGRFSWPRAAAQALDALESAAAQGPLS